MAMAITCMNLIQEFLTLLLSSLGETVHVDSSTTVTVLATAYNLHI